MGTCGLNEEKQMNKRKGMQFLLIFICMEFTGKNRNSKNELAFGAYILF